MGYIYKITNKINGKIYIGLTTRSIKQRWGQHQTECKRTDKYPNNKFYNALLKYGTKNFIVEQVEECDNTILPIREQYWISFYNSFIEGYNSDLGGGSGDVGEAVNQYDLCGHFIQSWSSASKAEREIKKGGAVTGTVAAACRQSKSLTAYGYQWRYLKEVQNFQNIEHIPAISKCSKPVDKYDLQGNYLESYLSFQEASKAVGCSAQAIGDACKGKCKTVKGFQWRYAWDTIQEVQNTK